MSIWRVWSPSLAAIGELGTQLGPVLCSTLVWDGELHLHRVGGIRFQKTVIRGRKSADYAEVWDGVVYLMGLGAFHGDAPGWWTVTEAEARRKVGLPPR